MRRLLLLLFMFVSTAFPWLKSYDAPPTLAAYSGKVDGDPQYGGVGQTMTCCWDSVKEIHLFTGSPGAGGDYNVEVRDYETNELVAHQYNATPAGDHRWLEFDSLQADGKFVRGREYLVKFTRPGDSIHYYDDIGSAYPYGHMVVGGQDHNSLDLCMRVYAQLDPIDSTFWGSNIRGCTIPSDR